MLSLRNARLTDYPGIFKTFEASIRQLASKDYNAAEIAAWIERGSNPKRWEKAIAKDEFLLAMDGSKIAGFSSLQHHHYIDFFFVSPEYSGQGVGRLLFDEWLFRAKTAGENHLEVHASKTAKPMFEHFGFTVMNEVPNDLNGTILVNYRMELRW